MSFLKQVHRPCISLLQPQVAHACVDVVHGWLLALGHGWEWTHMIWLVYDVHVHVDDIEIKNVLKKEMHRIKRRILVQT